MRLRTIWNKSRLPVGQISAPHPNGLPFAAVVQAHLPDTGFGQCWRDAQSRDTRGQRHASRLMQPSLIVCGDGLRCFTEPEGSRACNRAGHRQIVTLERIAIRREPQLVGVSDERAAIGGRDFPEVEIVPTAIPRDPRIGRKPDTSKRREILRMGVRRDAPQGGATQSAPTQTLR